MEREEFWISQQIGTMLGNQFEAAMKIKDTASLVQKFRTDSDNLVSYVEASEGESLPWLRHVLDALGQAHHPLAEKTDGQAENTETMAALAQVESKIAGPANLPMAGLGQVATVVLPNSSELETVRNQKR